MYCFWQNTPTYLPTYLISLSNWPCDAQMHVKHIEHPATI